MKKKVVGRVSEEEKNEIEVLFEHREALKSLVSSLSDEVLLEDAIVYDKYIAEIAEINYRYRSWWERMEMQYNWPKLPKEHLTIDFNTNEVSYQ